MKVATKINMVQFAAGLLCGIAMAIVGAIGWIIGGMLGVLVMELVFSPVWILTAQAMADEKYIREFILGEYGENGR